MLNSNLRERLSKLVIEGPLFLETVDSLIHVINEARSDEATMILSYDEEEIGDFSVELHIVVKRTPKHE